MRRTSISTLMPHILLAGVALFWGSTFLLTKLAGESAGPFCVVALRFVVASLALAALRPAALLFIRREELLAGLLLAAIAFTGYAAQSIALQEAPSARVAFVASLYVPLVPILALPLLREAPGAKAMMAAGLAVLGVGVLSGAFGGDLVFGPADGLSLLSALAIASEVVVLSRVVRHADPYRLALVVAGATGLFAILAAAGSGEALPGANGSLLVAAGLLGLGTAAAQLAMAWAQKRVRAAQAALLYATEPVFAGVIGVLAGEALAPNEGVGAAIIVGAIVLGSVRLALPKGVRPRARLRSARA